MRKLLLPVSLVFSLAATSAFAEMMTGEITSVNIRTRQIVMEDGQTYQFPREMDLTRFRAKQKVMITFQSNRGRNEATKIFYVR
jgi:hypothetical protein